MGYGTTSRQGRRTAGRSEPANPHPLILTIGVILTLGMEWMSLPGTPIFALATLIAAKMIRRPELTGKDAFKTPIPASKREHNAWDSYQRISNWHRLEDYDPRKPAFTLALGLGLLMGTRLNAWWMTGLETAGAMSLTLMILGTIRRHPGRIPVTARRVEWAKTRLKPCLTGMILGLIPATLIWAATGLLPPFLACPLIGVTLPLIPLWDNARRQASMDADSARVLASWIDKADKAPAPGMPRLVSDTRIGRHGERTFKLMATPVMTWVNRQIRDLLRPGAAGDHMDVAFVLDGSNQTRVICSITPTQPPDPMQLMDDPIGLHARVNMETARLGFNYNTWPGDAKLTIVARDRRGRARVAVYQVNGPQPDWQNVEDSWLRGSHDGELGDWGTLIGLNMIVDPGKTHAWIYAGGLDDLTWDERTAVRYRSQRFSHTNDTSEYLRLAQRAQTDRNALEQALKGSRLPLPPDMLYDTERILSGDGYALDTMTMTISKEGSVKVTDYMKVDLRASLGDSSVADFLPLANGSGGWYARYMLMVRSQPNQCHGMPCALRDCMGDGETIRLLARVIVSRACAMLLKHAPLVGECRQMAGDDSWTLWRTRISLTGGLTAMDVRRVQSRLQSMMGADTMLLEWEDAGTLVLWAGGVFPNQQAMWKDQRDRRDATRLRLDACWADAGATTRDGRTVRTLDVRPATGQLTRLSMMIPTGLDPDRIDKTLDTFLASARFAFCKRMPTGMPDRFDLLVCDRDPLPDRVEPDWTMLDPNRLRMPFGVLDDGNVAYWDPRDTPHLLASGTTGSGKSSVSMTIVQAALRLGCQVAVTDPSKGANDFRPIRRHLIAFEDTLEGCCALFRWARMEMERRVELVKTHGGGDVNGLPDEVRPKPLLIQCDEFNSLLQKDQVSGSYSLGDPQIDNENTMIRWRNDLRASIGLNVSKLLTQGRSANIMLLLGAQQLMAKDLDMMPSAGTAKNMLGRVFLGSGNTMGNVSAGNVREANRLLAQAVRGMGMPKGRGIYERMGRSVDMIQCWYSGSGEGYARACADLPDVEQVDLSGFVPAKPELVGMVDRDGGDRIVSDSLDLDGFILDD